MKKSKYKNTKDKNIDHSINVEEENVKYSVDDILAETRRQRQQSLEEETPVQEEKPVKKKKKLFGRKKKDFEEEEDIYYGIQMKPLDEFRKGFDSTGEIPNMDDTFAKLFDDTIPSLDEEVERNFARIQQERRRRVAEAVETAGVDVDEVADELGIVAPPPVTSFAADPYTKQHGVDLETGGDAQDDLTRAMLEGAKSQTMEIKLNVLNDTVEIQKNMVIPAVDDETVNKIIESAEFMDMNSHSEDALEEEIPEEISEDILSTEAPEISVEEPAETEIEEAELTEENTHELNEELPEAEETGATEDTEDADVADSEESEDVYSVDDESGSKDEEDRLSPNTFKEFPQLEDVTKYRPRTLPVHRLNIDVVQSAVLTEEALYDRESRKEQKAAPFKRFASKFEDDGPDESQESIDDYVSRADAKAVAADLKGSLGRISLRLIITAISTAVLFIAGFFCEGRGNTGAGLVYIILNLIFIGLSVGFCYRNIINGIKSVVKFKADSDSAAAVAVIAVLVQTVLSIFDTQGLADGKIHLYGAVVTGILLVNTFGKMTLLKRIYANFRFVSSPEEKYAVKIYDDYNTSLKFAKDTVAGTPVIAYQKKAGFLKRFLEISYEPDPSEVASHNMAPFTLVLSLVICIITTLVTKNISYGLASLAAAACIGVTVTNMTALNVPIADLCKRARKVGAMVSGYEAIEEVASVNAIMIDETDLFPQGTVVLEGVKTFDSENLEASITAATALIDSVGGTVADVFNQVITKAGVELPKVSNVVLEDAHGVSGDVNGKHVLVGNRDILVNHSITPPEREDVIKYLGSDRKPLFVAVDGKLEAMLVLSYKADKRKKNELRKMEEEGVSVIIRSVDANMTPKFVSKLFDVSESSVRVITGKLGQEYDKAVDGEIPRADALIATKGRAESMMSVVTACIKEKKIFGLILAAQNIAVIIGIVLVALLSFSSGIGQLSSYSLIFYQLFWMIIIACIPKIKLK